jgi:hypothetical protein
VLEDDTSSSSTATAAAVAAGMKGAFDISSSSSSSSANASMMMLQGDGTDDGANSLPHLLAKYAQVYNKNGRIGIYTRQEREAIIARFKAKRQRRVWRKKVCICAGVCAQRPQLLHRTTVAVYIKQDTAWTVYTRILQQICR